MKTQTHRHSQPAIQYIGLMIALCLTVTACTDTGTIDSSWSPQPDEPRAFVTTLGTDTLTVERYLRTPTHIEGELVERTPYTHKIEYTADLNTDGFITSLRGKISTPAENEDGPAPIEWTVAIGDEETTVTRTGGQNPGTVNLEAGTGAIPTLGRASNAMFVFEQTARQVLDDISGSDGVALIGPTSARPRPNASTVVAQDTISMDFFGSPRLGWVDEQGQLLGVSGEQTTMKSETRRVRPTFDPDAMASRWASMDVSGTGIGTPSPGATVSTTVADANLEIVYSQPAKRGRTIWGGLVPYGKVWRTGANAATQFSTDRPLDFAGIGIPAGTYTLWSTFGPESQTLIVNSQSGQWGTQHDPSQDFAKIPMRKSALDEPSERFTISVSKTATGGVLNLDWDRTRFSADFEVK